MRSATRFLQYSRSRTCSRVTAVSASSAMLTMQLFFLVCNLYFESFSNKVVHLLEKLILVF